MHLHDLNPHVVNSLLCLIGIVLCLVLIACGTGRPQRRPAQRHAPAALKIGRPHQGSRGAGVPPARPGHEPRPLMYGPHIILGEDENQPFRQVA